MKIGGVRGDLHLFLPGNAAKIFRFCGSGQVTNAKDLRFFVSFLGKAARDGIAAHAFGRGKIHGEHGELGGSASLEEENVVVLA